MKPRTRGKLATEYDVTVTTTDTVRVWARNLGEAKRLAERACARMEREIWASYWSRRKLGKQRATKVTAVKP